MRRLPVLLLAAAVTAPLTTVLPTLSLPAAKPKPVPASVSSVGLSGVDPAVLAGSDNGMWALAAAAASLAAAASGSPAAASGAPGAQPGPGAPGAPGTQSGPSAVRRQGLSAAGVGTPGLHPVVVTPPRRTRSFSSVGVTWDLPSGPAAPVLVVVRTHDAHGWSPWTALDTDSAGLTDASARGTQRGGTAPLWVGPSDGVQVRVDAGQGRAPGGLRVELVDPGTSDYDGRWAQPRRGRRQRPPASPGSTRGLPGAPTSRGSGRRPR